MSLPKLFNRVVGPPAPLPTTLSRARPLWVTAQSRHRVQTRHGTVQSRHSPDIESRHGTAQTHCCAPSRYSFKVSHTRPLCLSRVLRSRDRVLDRAIECCYTYHSRYRTRPPIHRLTLTLPPCFTWKARPYHAGPAPCVYGR